MAAADAIITTALMDEVPGVRHGFFTRHGGVSEGLFASLNCGFGSGDAPDRVAVNRDLAMRTLGLRGDDLVTLRQIHSASAVVVDAPWKPGQAPTADGMVTRDAGVALGVLSADCAPVLLADPGAAVIGVAHAGWRGARAGIVEATADAMTGLGARKGDIRAAVGPCIQRRSYEVGPEFHAVFVAEDPKNGDLFDTAGRAGRFHFDLARYVARRLDRLGIAAEVLPCDTCADAERFFSYRRNTLGGLAQYGRGLSAIALVN